MTDKKLSYGSYLQLDRILQSQVLKSSETGKTVHDEMLFIIIHQTYELWFKQILHELDSVLDMFQGNYVQEENLPSVYITRSALGVPSLNAHRQYQYP